MAARKRVGKKTKRIETVIPQSEESMCKQDERCFCCQFTKNKTAVLITILTAILILALALSRGYILVAIVNNKPIFRFQLTQTLVSRYGKQTLEAIISERLIADEARKSGISVTQEEITTQEEDILKSFGGKVTLDELLTYQGTTRADFDSQIRLQLLVNKLLEKGVVVTDKEIADYRQTNAALLISTDEASLNDEARKALLEQKINEKIQPWFTELKNKAKIFKFF